MILGKPKQRIVLELEMNLGCKSLSSRTYLMTHISREAAKGLVDLVESACSAFTLALPHFRSFTFPFTLALALTGFGFALSLPFTLALTGFRFALSLPFALSYEESGDNATC
jgi:hypothetical protein